MNKNSINAICRKFGFEVHGLGYIQAVKKSSFKEDPFGKQRELLGKGVSTIFDVGANFGDTVLEYRKQFPQAMIYAFEPFPATFEAMKEKLREQPNIRFIPKAVSDHEGVSAFYVNSNVDTNSLLPSQETGLNSDQQVKLKEKIEVELVSIDEFCRKNGIDHIDILKLDIQGGELGALMGAEGMLKRGTIRLIYSETYFTPQYINQPLFYEIGAYLARFGYHLQDFYQPIYGNNRIAWCDVIFIRK